MNLHGDARKDPPHSKKSTREDEKSGKGMEKWADGLESWILRLNMSSFLPKGMVIKQEDALQT